MEQTMIMPRLVEQLPASLTNYGAADRNGPVAEPPAGDQRVPAPDQRPKPGQAMPWSAPPWHRQEPVSTTSSPAASTPVDKASNKAGEPAKPAAASAAGKAPPAAASSRVWQTRLDDKTRAASTRNETGIGQAFDRLKELSKLVAAGDAAALGELRRILDSNEAIWRQVGDVADVSQKILIAALSGDSVLMVESTERHVAELKQSLLVTSSSPLEAMAIQRVVCCWLLTHYLDRCVAVAVERGSRVSDLGRLQVLAEKRYLTSLRTLALVRQIEPSVTQRQQQPTGRPSEAVGTHSSTSSMASTPSTDGSADEAKPADVAA